MTPRFPLGMDMRRALPPLAGKFLRDSLPELVETAQPAGRVIFFTGCLINYVYPRVGLSVVNVLKINGLEVLIPARQHCCGSPLTLMGEHELATRMALSHVEMLSTLQCDAIITACGTCGGSFREYYPALLEGGRWGAMARALAEKTFDISQYLEEKVRVKPDRLGPLETTFTYHEPCHLARGMGVKDQPVDLLKKIPGLHYLPLKDPGRCCGGSGSFSFTNYKTSRAVRLHKIKDILTTGAKLVATGCGSCRMHLQDWNSPETVMHTVEILDQSYRISERGE